MANPAGKVRLSKDQLIAAQRQEIRELREVLMELCDITDCQAASPEPWPREKIDMYIRGVNV